MYTRWAKTHPLGAGKSLKIDNFRYSLMQRNRWQKSILHISKCVKSHLQQCGISKIFTTPDRTSKRGQGAEKERERRQKHAASRGVAWFPCGSTALVFLQREKS